MFEIGVQPPAIGMPMIWIGEDDNGRTMDATFPIILFAALGGWAFLTLLGSERARRYRAPEREPQNSPVPPHSSVAPTHASHKAPDKPSIATARQPPRSAPTASATKK